MSRFFDTVGKRVVFLVALATLVASCWLLVWPGSRRVDWSQPRLRERRCLGTIGNALSCFRGDHGGRLPKQLSELVPRYISITNAYCFFAGYQGVPQPLRLENQLLFHAIDHDGAFFYLGDAGQPQDLVLYVRTAASDVKDVMTLANDLSGLPRSRNDLENRLRALRVIDR